MMAKAQKLQMCSGCRENFYNGNNDLGVKECWSLKDATSVKRVRVGLWQRPPWGEVEVKVLSCYREEGAVYMTLQEVRANNHACRQSIARAAIAAAEGE